MTVEFVIAIPVFMVGLIVMFNVLMFVSECARFDRVAGEIARSSVVNSATASADLSTSLGYKTGSPFGARVRNSNAVPLTSHTKVTCILTYQPWPFNGFAFGGIKVGEWQHAQSFVIDVFQPGALF